MKNPLDLVRRVRVCRLPIHMFHGALAGVFLGTLLTLAIHWSGSLIATVQAEPNPTPPPTGPTPPPPTPTPNLNPTPEDLDGDGIPNIFEVRYHHDPDNAADAGADFDNDGLTAKQEYDLSVQTNGTSGNPLGNWRSETVPTPPGIDNAYFYPIQINDVGTMLVSGDVYNGETWRSSTFTVTPDGIWTEILKPEAAPDGYLWASDMNDKGEVVGAGNSADGSQYEPFIWDSTSGYRPFTFKGRKATACKINNHGDWIGYTEDASTGEWKAAYVLDGVNQRASGDWWPYLWFTDINDYGEVMGTSYNPQSSTYSTILAYQSWFFDTGLLGSEPSFDENTSSWSWSSAMNAYGEFTGGSSGLRQNQLTYLGYHFDGAFNELKMPGENLQYISPESLNSSNTITGYAETESYTTSGAFIYRDGIGLFLEKLLPEIGPCYSATINNLGQILANSGNVGIMIISPAQDNDGDGMSDDWEDAYGLDKFDPGDAFLVSSNDGINNLGKFLLRANPNEPLVLNSNGVMIDSRPGVDSDGDGMPNVWEWDHSLNYNDSSDAPLDLDRDGYTNLQEFRLNTDPRGAPIYRIHEPGPFPNTRSTNITSAVLGAGRPFETCLRPLDGACQDSLHFSVQSDDGSWYQRPASWLKTFDSQTGSLTVYQNLSNNSYSYDLATSASGACVRHTYGNPNTIHYWASATAAPITLSGAPEQNDFNYLYYPVLSPGGNFLAATRSPFSNSGTYDLIVWKMPLSPTQTWEPVKLTPPAGISLNVWQKLSVNDFGFVVGFGTNANGQSIPILWTLNASATSAESVTLPPLPGGRWARAAGLTNHSSPLVAGTSDYSSGQARATVWTANGTATNLGTLPNGNSSEIFAVSPAGFIAGRANALVSNNLADLPFIASPSRGSTTATPNPTAYQLTPQGTDTNSFSITTIADSGEMTGMSYQYSPVYKQIPTLWRHGSAFPLDALLPQSSGYTLESVSSINSNGTLLARAWKDGAQTTLLLTPDGDTDGDGMSDAYENQHGFNAFETSSSTADSDSDGLSDLDEFRNGTHPRNPDTDSDGMNDGWEVSWGFLPLDPTDAGLDPDGDHVTNLRESEIGTTPTGIYKLENRLTDTDWNYPSITAVSDSGQILHTGQSRYDSGITPDETQNWYSYSQDYFALPASSEPDAPSISLPGSSSFQSYNNDWTNYSGSWDSPTYFPDPSTGAIRAFIQRGSYSYDGSNWTGTDTAFLTQDVLTHPDETTWMSWETIQNNLRTTTDADGQPALAADETLNTWPLAVSNTGNFRLHQTSSYSSVLMLDAEGNLLHKLPGSDWWQVAINNHGQVATVVQTYVEATPDTPASYAPEVRIFDNGTLNTLPLPHTPGIDSNASVQSIADDGKILLSISSPGTQGVGKTEYHLLDSRTGTLARVKQPGLGNESFVSLSSENGRTLGTGPKPWQTTPDGTCIKLEALRIQNSPGETAVPFGSLYPNIPDPRHISPTGTVTLTAQNSQWQQEFLQIVPHNDADGDGVPDDFASDLGNRLQILNPVGSAILNEAGATLLDLFISLTTRVNSTDPPVTTFAGLLDWYYDILTAQNPEWPYLDDDRDGLLNGKERQIRTNPRMADTDSDEMRDAEDADPLDPAVDWRRTSEPGWILKELPVPYELDSAKAWVSDVSLNGAVLFKRVNAFGWLVAEILVDRNGVAHQTPALAGTISVDMGGATALLSDSMLVLAETRPTFYEFKVWDPASNALTPFHLPCYPDDILDAPTGFDVRRNIAPHPYVQSEADKLWWSAGGKSGRLDGSSGIWGDLRVESGGNVLAGSQYWKWNPDRLSYDPPISIPTPSQWGRTDASATLRQNRQAGLTFTRNIMPASEEVWVSNPGSGLYSTNLSRTAIKPDAKASFVSATTDGWLVEGGAQGRAWANGKWQPLRHLVTGPRPESLNVVKMRDNGVGVALVEFPESIKKYMLMIPAAATELAPCLPVDETAEAPVANALSAIPNYLRRDEAGNIIENLDTTNPMVERDPLGRTAVAATSTAPAVTGIAAVTDASTRRIAWREIKVKVGKMLAGQTVTWSMTPLFTPFEEFWPGPPYANDYRELRSVTGGPRFRGEWTHAARDNDKYRFGSSEHFNAYGFNETNRNQTTVDAEGYTAIRANLPPIGFNKARISIEITGVPGSLDILDLEVPAVVVIDPGHGGVLPETEVAKRAAGYTYSSRRGEWTLDGSSTNHATSYGTPTSQTHESSRVKTDEKTLTLRLGLLLRNDFKRKFSADRILGKVTMTRDTDRNIGFEDRTGYSQKMGADNFLSLHFNGGDSAATRGSEVWIEPAAPRPGSPGHVNENHDQDSAFAIRILNAMVGAIPDGMRREYRPGEGPKEYSEDGGTSIPTDTYCDRLDRLGNEGRHPKSRACLAEIEYITNQAVETALISGPSSDTNRRILSDAMAGAVIRDIKIQLP